MNNYENPFNLAPPPGGPPPQTAWCLRRQIALLLILAGFSLFALSS